MEVGGIECEANSSNRKRSRKERETRLEHGRRRNISGLSMDRDMTGWLDEICNSTDS